MVIVNDVFGVAMYASEPSWVAEVALPGQDVIDREIADLSSRIQTLKADRERAIEARKQHRSLLGLMYQQGAGLEQAVRAALGALGAEVHDPPPEVHNDDGWLSIDIDGVTHYAVIEVKGVSRPTFEVKGLRQLQDWKSDAMEHLDHDFKGFFFGNSSIADPPEMRDDPFDPNWIARAKRFGFCGLTTTTLLRAFTRDQRGELDRVAFWRLMFATNGVFGDAELNRCTVESASKE